MNSIHKERFQLCMKHQESDRPPISLSIDKNDPIVRPRILEYFSLKNYSELMDHLQIDIAGVGPKIAKKHEIRKQDLSMFFLPYTDPKYFNFSAETG